MCDEKEVPSYRSRIKRGWFETLKNVGIILGIPVVCLLIVLTFYASLLAAATYIVVTVAQWTGVM